MKSLFCMVISWLQLWLNTIYNICNLLGYTALHDATKGGFQEIAEILIANGANLGEKNGVGKYIHIFSKINS